ncbi:hypothetical protein DO97_15915 [Neosynechococcus sphagnicola sy1]|uniref:Uncharacterized protein n=1 Tax=Neosynechococcus sphagnicola sy1 TaxID=1497020 RepID=A0A098TGN6_9CYAN|nr:hypothetical protein DO97_15915 [Neosynechococcus sphagnicola sy1]
MRKSSLKFLSELFRKNCNYYSYRSVWFLEICLFDLRPNKQQARLMFGIIQHLWYCLSTELIKLHLLEK